MQLVAYGAQDVYITGNPQITYWKVVYRRHTNFSMETVEHTLGGNPDFGKKSVVTIIRNGDLAAKVCLMVTVDSVSWTPKITGGVLSPKFAWVRRLGHALIKSVEIEIGGSEIDKQYGVWMDLWYELTHNVNQEKGYRNMIGDHDDLTRLDEPDASGNLKTEHTLYIPLQFWFCRNSGLALPLIALQYHEVRLNFEFEAVNKLVVWQTDDKGNSLDLKSLRMKEASVLVEYVYLDSVERRRFAQVGHEYLIEQVQFTGDESVTGSGNNVQMKSKLGFNHPTKELVWCVRNATFCGDDKTSGSAGVGHPFLCYSHTDDGWSSALDSAANNLASGMFEIVAGAVVNTIGSALTNQYVDVDLLIAGTTGAVFTALVPTSSSHSIRLNVFAQGVVANLQSVLRINRYPLMKGVLTSSGASLFNYADYIDEVQVNIALGATNAVADNTFVATVLAHRLDLNMVSVPVDSNNLVDSRLVNGLAPTSTGNPRDVIVIQPNNYGLRLDGKGNPVEEAGLQLNGHDRFDPRLSGYFNYVQPHCHHSRTPADGVNVYSFALHPEQHQPSGTCNLSRIDSAVLVLKLSDPLRNLFGKVSQLVVDITNSSLWVFAFSYNVLRIVSGMGGIAYSN